MLYTDKKLRLANAVQMIVDSRRGRTCKETLQQDNQPSTFSKLIATMNHDT